MSPTTRSQSNNASSPQQDRSSDTNSASSHTRTFTLVTSRPVEPNQSDISLSSPDTWGSSGSQGPSLVDQLRLRLGDGPDLMDDRFYLSALLVAEGDLDEAVRMVENNDDFDLVDESLVEETDVFRHDNVEDIIAELETVPTAAERASNPGPWNPRPGSSRRLDVPERRKIDVFETLAYPHITDEDVTIDYLEGNDWDVAAAHAQWVSDRAEVLRRSASTGRMATMQQDSNLLKFMMDSGVPFNDNVEQERRDAARVLRDAVNNKPPPVLRSRISISEAILQLHIAGFDLTTAFQRFSDRESLWEVLSFQFDYMRAPTASRVDQDERLAILATITQRVDLAALERLLEQHQWDLIRTIVAWYRTGVKPTRHPKDKDSNKATLGWNRRCDALGVPRPMPTEEEASVAQRVEKGWALEVKEYQAGGTNNQPARGEAKVDSHLGSVINEHIEPIKKGPPRPAKLQFESIWNGKYWSGTFKHTKYRWIDQDHPDFAALDEKTKQTLLQKPAFDWTDRNHLEHLNKWRRQRFQRATSDKIRPASQPFSQEERDYLYDLSKEHIEGLMKRTGRTWDQCLTQEIPEQVKQRWTDKFNAEFVGTMPAPHKRPIQPRNTGSLMTQRTRIERIRKDFKIGQLSMIKNDNNSEEDGGSSEEHSDTDTEMDDVEE